MKRWRQAADLAREVVEHGNTNSISDGGVAALACRTAAEGAYLNIIINVPGINDEAFNNEVLGEAKALRSEIVAHTEKTVSLAESVAMQGN
jgi:formiminotetrahydrofolate cyclodeaminase